MSNQRNESIFKAIDWLTILLYLMIVAVGCVAIYTAEYDDNPTGLFDMATNHGKQLVWLGVALGVAFVIQFFDGKFYSILSPIIYLSAIGSLIAVMFLGQEVAGSRSWFNFGAFKFQPAEFAKFATALAVAKYVSFSKVNVKSFQAQVIATLLIGLPMGLIIFQGDTGSALVFLAFVLVLYREGLSSILLILGLVMVILFVAALLYNFTTLLIALAVIALLMVILKDGINIKSLGLYAALMIASFVMIFQLEEPHLLIALGVLCVALISIYWFSKKIVWLSIGLFLGSVLYVQSVDYGFNEILKPHQQQRIEVILGTIEDSKGVGYNLHQSKIAIGSGGIFGKGFLNGTQNKGKFVPELSTDFIFCTIGEEFGYLGSLGLISLFSIFLFRITMLAERQKAQFGRVYGYCVASIIFFHFFINIGMTIGIVPIIGIPLPFVSYGGSSLISFTVLVFILIRLDVDRKQAF